MAGRYDWYNLAPLDLGALANLRTQYHVAIQNVAAVGRRFLDPSPEDANAVLHWVPGLWRMAGKWIHGDETFRSSICLENFHIYLVNEKVNTLSSFDLAGRHHTEVMLWLEEQIGVLQLAHGELSLHLPYDLPNYPVLKNQPFDEPDLVLSKDFGGLYHDSFMMLLELREQFAQTSEIIIWPHHFDQAIRIILKETGETSTNTFVSAGFSPGDHTSNDPYFYVNSWPYVDATKLVSTLPCGEWYSGEWTGAILPVRDLWSVVDQQKQIDEFYYSAIDRLSTILLD